MLLHSMWVTLMVKAVVVAVLALPKLAVKMLHWSEEGMYMCSPVLVPQIMGVAEGS